MNSQPGCSRGYEFITGPSEAETKTERQGSFLSSTLSPEPVRTARGRAESLTGSRPAGTYGFSRQLL